MIVVKYYYKYVGLNGSRYEQKYACTLVLLFGIIPIFYRKELCE